MKLYLDTDIIYGFFKEVVKSWDEHRKINSPSVIRFLKEKESNINLFITELVYLELVKRIKSDYDVSEEKIEWIIDIFEKSLNVRTIPRKFWLNERTFDDIYELVKRNRFKIGLTDILHAYIARENNLTLLTGDAKLMEDARKIWENIIDYPQLRNRFQ